MAEEKIKYDLLGKHDSSFPGKTDNAASEQRDSERQHCWTQPDKKETGTENTQVGSEDTVTGSQNEKAQDVKAWAQDNLNWSKDDQARLENNEKSPTERKGDSSTVDPDTKTKRPVSETCPEISADSSDDSGTMSHKDNNIGSERETSIGETQDAGCKPKRNINQCSEQDICGGKKQIKNTTPGQHPLKKPIPLQDKVNDLRQDANGELLSTRDMSQQDTSGETNLNGTPAQTKDGCAGSSERVITGDNQQEKSGATLPDMHDNARLQHDPSAVTLKGMDVGLNRDNKGSQKNILQETAAGIQNYTCGQRGPTEEEKSDAVKTMPPSNKESRLDERSKAEIESTLNEVIRCLQNDIEILQIKQKDRDKALREYAEKDIKSQVRLAALQERLTEKEETINRMKQNESRITREKEEQKAKLSEKQGEIQRLTQQLQQAAGQINQEKYKNNQMRCQFSELSKQNEARFKQIQAEKTQVEAEKQNILLRLSKVAGANLTYNNPNVADLSDEKRPTKLAEEFSELYDNEWTDAFEELDITNEEGKTSFMLKLIMRANQLCQDISNGHINKIKDSLSTIILPVPVMPTKEKKQIQTENETKHKLNPTEVTKQNEEEVVTMADLSGNTVEKPNSEADSNKNSCENEDKNLTDETLKSGDRTVPDSYEHENNAKPSKVYVNDFDETGKRYPDDENQQENISGDKTSGDSNDNEENKNPDGKNLQENIPRETTLCDSEDNQKNENHDGGMQQENISEDLSNDSEDKKEKENPDGASPRENISENKSSEDSEDNVEKKNSNDESPQDNVSGDTTAVDSGNKKEKENPNDLNLQENISGDTAAVEFEEEQENKNSDGENQQDNTTKVESPSDSNDNSEKETSSGNDPQDVTVKDKPTVDTENKNIKGREISEEKDGNGKDVVTQCAEKSKEQDAITVNSNPDTPDKNINDEKNQDISSKDIASVDSEAKRQKENSDVENYQEYTLKNKSQRDSECIGEKNITERENSVEKDENGTEVLTQGAEDDNGKDTTVNEKPTKQKLHSDFELLRTEQKKTILEAGQFFETKLAADLETVCTDIIMQDEEIDRERKGNVVKYIKKCVNICWSMSRHDPPVYIDIPDLAENVIPFDTNIYKPYTKSGKHVAFIVWPALYLHKDGPMLSKGVAQGK